MTGSSKYASPSAKNLETAINKQQNKQTKEVPGDIALWFFLLAELAVFGILILGFALARKTQPEMFLSGLNQLHLSSGIINTLALLTGSFFAALGVKKVRQQHPKSYYYFITAAISGCIYLIIKAVEYIDLYSLGYSLHTNTFFGFYFFTTFFHYLHALAGILILLIVANWLRSTKESTEKRNRAAECIASYWHTVDLIWIVLLPTLYLLK